MFLHHDMGEQAATLGISWQQQLRAKIDRGEDHDADEDEDIDDNESSYIFILSFKDRINNLSEKYFGRRVFEFERTDSCWNFFRFHISSTLTKV
ncbi:unnamed protein product [Rhodiola kirilowii]